MVLTLYHHNSSVCAAKIRVALAEKGLLWESRLMRLDGDQFDPSYLALNPAAVVPTLVHDDVVVIESNVILEYLEDAFPDVPLRPESPADRAAARALMMRLDGGTDGLHHAASVLTFGIAYRMRLVEAAGGSDPERLAPLIAAQMNPTSRAWLEEVVYRGIEAPVVRQCLLRFDRLLADFETRLCAARWLSGPRFSFTDAAFAPYMVRLELLHLGFLWRGRPGVSAWLDRLKARASMGEIVDWYAPENRAALHRYGAACAAQMEAMINA
ncbi:MAG: glutathione S-transferase family protein [Pseudomonadota bacterium]